jgi:hypothetical protein
MNPLPTPHTESTEHVCYEERHNDVNDALWHGATHIQLCTCYLTTAHILQIYSYNYYMVRINC